MRTYHMGCLLFLWVDLNIHHYFYREGGFIWEALHPAALGISSVPGARSSITGDER